MKKIILITALLISIISNILNAQVAVTNDGSSADPSAMLEIKSTDKGLLLPRMTQAERDAIASPVAGLVVWCTNCGIHGEMQVFNGSAWTNMTGGTAAIAIPWSCGSNLIDSRDGKTYSTVLIGNQCWMAQNLNVGTRINGSADQTNNSVIEKYCYSNNESNCNIYGGLYQWNEMMQYVSTEGIKGICPTGWHLPADAEWTALITYLGGQYFSASGKMKETGTAHWTAPNTNATNYSGFTALPGGRFIYGISDNMGSSAYFWSSTEREDNPNNAWYRTLKYDNDVVYLGPNLKTDGFSVRCIQD